MSENPQKLSSRLKELGFLPVLDTEEKTPVRSYQKVGKGIPRTYDAKNGVTVVYDEGGCPQETFWGDYDRDKFRDLTKEYELRWGAYVPHAYDRGKRLREMMSKSA